MSKRQPYRELANSIVLTAVEDYRELLKYDIDHFRKNGYLVTRKEIEKFFMSEWFTILTHLNGTSVMNRLRKEYGYGQRWR
jgi:hypothetical protein